MRVSDMSVCGNVKLTQTCAKVLAEYLAQIASCNTLPVEVYLSPGKHTLDVTSSECMSLVPQI